MMFVSFLIAFAGTVETRMTDQATAVDDGGPGSTLISLRLDFKVT